MSAFPLILLPDTDPATLRRVRVRRASGVAGGGIG